jgi:hypothetical protein
VYKLRADLSQGMLAIIRCRIFFFHFGIKNIKIKIYRIVILPFVLYGCETWSLILREEQRLRALDRVLMGTFGSKRDELTGEWRKLKL